MISKIDSIEISMNKANIRDLDVLKKADKSTYKKAYIQKVIDRNERLFIVIHNDYDTSKETYKLEYFFTQLDYILNDLGIVDQSQVRLNRVDYCFDYKVDVTRRFKVLSDDSYATFYFPLLSFSSYYYM